MLCGQTTEVNFCFESLWSTKLDKLDWELCQLKFAYILLSSGCPYYPRSVRWLKRKFKKSKSVRFANCFLWVYFSFAHSPHTESINTKCYCSPFSSVTSSLPMWSLLLRVVFCASWPIKRPADFRFTDLTSVHKVKPHKYSNGFSESRHRVSGPRQNCCTAALWLVWGFSVSEPELDQHVFFCLFFQKKSQFYSWGAWSVFTWQAGWQGEGRCQGHTVR